MAPELLAGNRRFQAVLTAWVALFLLVGAVEGTLRFEGPDVGILEDAILATLYVFLPLILFTAGRVEEAMERLLAAFPRLLDVDGQTAAEEAEAVRAGLRPGGRRRSVLIAVYGMAVLLVLIFQVLLPIAFPSEVRPWTLMPERPLTFVVAVLWSSFLFCGLLAPICWFIVETALLVFPTLHRYGKARQLLVIPVAPDGQGGMAVVAEFALALTLVPGSAVVFGLLWGLLFGVDHVLFIGFSLYLAFLSATFFLPLLSVHRAMKEAKERELARLGELFRVEYSRLPTSEEIAARGDSVLDADLSKRVALMAQVEDLYRRAEEMPVWPFNFETLRRFLGLTVAPAMLFLFQLVTENAITRWLQGVL